MRACTVSAGDADEIGFPIRAGGRANTAGKVQNSLYVGITERGKGERVPAAEALTGNDDARGIDIGLPGHVVDDRRDVVRLVQSIRRDVTAVWIKNSAGAGETAHHRQGHGITSGKKIAGDVGRAIPGLLTRLSGLLAVI